MPYAEAITNTRQWLGITGKVDSTNILKREVVNDSLVMKAEAMRSLNKADENTDLSLVLKVINENNSIPFIRQGLFYPASPVEIVVSLSLTFSVSVVFFVGAIVGWISVSEIYYSRMTGLNESSEISEETYNERK